MKIPHLEYLRGLSSPEFPDLGSKLFEALHAIQQQTTTVEQQTNSNSTGPPPTPPPVAGLTVQAQNGHFQIAVKDPSPIYRGVKYFVEHADNPHFTNSHVIDMGTSRNHNVFLGNVTRYWRAYSSYSASSPSDPVYHGSRAIPEPVSGGGSVGGPAFASPEGSGTGQSGQTLEGPGKVPFRSVSGAPPVR